MKNRLCQFDVTKVTRTFRHILVASGALELSVDGTKSRVVQSSISWLQLTLVHRLGVQNVGNTHVLDLLWRQQTKLYLLNRAQRRIRVREVEVRHDDGFRLSKAKQAERGE